MRALILQIVLLGSTIIPCTAQDKGKSELTISFGIMPAEDVAAEFLTIFFLALAGRFPEGKLDDNAFALAYKYHVSERFSLGASGAYNASAQETRFFKWYDNEPRPKTLAIAAESNFFYLKRPKINLYSSMSAGFFGSWKNEYNGISNTSFISPTLHYSPVGIRVGRDTGGFVELGYGFKGLVSGGLSIRF
ncbi:hypothetical protein LXM25_04790 [Dyadobacter sp. LJ53]|uniref:hypothetical protein n=1 Tax=Dyadobacter chenwenxiniae TaxID=2906456 RepID=UPI001F1EB41A|nr:hypothetical protein [Dyadobacter chenwenxiniae]MCF0049362.1 hypothetical protein [Dyadobacter chenwenxiniae]